MFRNKSKITPGLVYALDKDNVCKQDTSGISMVEAVELVGKKDGEYVWKVKPIEEFCKEDSFMNIKESYLFPINTPIIRLPLDLPIINDKDLEVIGHVASEALKSDNIELHKRLLALYKKLEFYKSMREV